MCLIHSLAPHPHHPCHHHPHRASPRSKRLPLTDNKLPMDCDSDSALLWDRRYAELTEWNRSHGHCNVPKAEGRLGRWVVRQRELHKKAKLEPDRKAHLDRLGFVWNTNEAAWEHKYALLLRYNRANGHCCVPISDPNLGMWVAKMRANRRKNKLPQHRIHKLDAIDFIWNTAEADWMDKFEKLLVFRAREGHACVPFNEGELGWWVNTQRQSKRKGKLSPKREQLLNNAHFVWNPQQFLAERRRQAARARAAEKRSPPPATRDSSSPEPHPKRLKPRSPSIEKPLFVMPASPDLPSTTSTPFETPPLEDTPRSWITERTESPRAASSSSSSSSFSRRSDRGDVHSIASLLSPCPNPALPPRLPHRTLEFPAQPFEVPSYHSDRSVLSCVRSRRAVATNFVLPPISSLKDLSNHSRK